MSGCSAKRFGQCALGAKENEYRSDGASQAAPGYVLSRQTPPSPSALSIMVNASWPRRFSSSAAARPPNPAPTMSTDGVLVMSTTVGTVTQLPRERCGQE